MREITPEELNGNVFKMIDSDWMLVTAADGEKINTMTASWGGLGIIWEKPVAFVFIRPQRHTFGFTERNTRMTLSFFGDGYKKALAFCGKYSGRDFDKAKECALTPVFDENESGRAVWFDEARLVIKTKKLYAQPLGGEFALSDAVTSCYPNNDYHTMYVCEIEEILVKE